MKSIRAGRRAGTFVPANALFLPFLLLALTTTFSCSRDAAFNKAYAAIDRGRSADKALADLVRLDQEFPDSVAVKLDIGMLILQRGDPSAAAPFLERARTLAGKHLSPAQKATLFGGLAIVSYSRGEYAAAVEDGKKALATNVDSAAPFGFITGRALIALEKEKEALELLDAAWSKARSSMTREDYRAYARALESAGRSQDLISVLDSYETAWPYEPGLGLMQSAAYERKGDFDSSVLAAFKEAEYAVAYGASRIADVQKNLAAIARKLDDPAFNPQGSGKSVLQAVSAFAHRQWVDVERILSPRSATTSFEKYLLLSARIEARHAATADVDAFSALLPVFRSLPPYFYRLYVGLREAGGSPANGQNEDRLTGLLENAIDLAPRTEAAAGYRKELAAALGLAPADAGRLPTRSELTTAADKAAATGESSLLEPLIGSLELRDNRLTLMAVGILRAFAQDARHRPWFFDRLHSSSGRTRERLRYILGR